MQTWQLQEAKNKLSQVVENALSEGPQVISRRGEEVAVVLSLDEYRRLTAMRGSLIDFFRESPLVGVELDLQRDVTPVRDGFQVES